MFFDISWGEIAVLTGATLALVGRKDLPIVSRVFGQQLGRIVGLVHGARIRADRFASDHQLKRLQNEFKSGLRELDAVKAELAGSMMHRGGGNNLGALVPGVDRRKDVSVDSSMIMMGGTAEAGVGVTADGSSTPPPSQLTASSSMGADYLAAARQAEEASQQSSSSGGAVVMAARLAPRSQSVAAVAEEEWEKRGIGFRSIAEGRMQQQQQNDSTMGVPPGAGGGGGGAVILSNYLRQSLIYDQYERTVREQDEALRSRVEKVRNEHMKNDDKENKVK